MTLSTTPTQSPPPVESSVPTPSVPIAAARAASAETLQTHSDDRWSRWAVKSASRDFISQRRFQIIAGIIATGVIAWLFWTS